ncbi:peptidase [Streptomyces vinaceus]
MDHVAPGTVIHRRLLVSNTSDKKLHLELYAAAAEIRADEFISGQGRAGNDLASWASFDQDNLDLSPGGEKQVRVTISVPRRASSGERYAVLLAEVSSPSGPGKIQVVNRVGVRTYLNVGPGGEPNSDFRIDAIKADFTRSGLPRVTVRVHNTGHRALDISGKLNLSERDGPLAAGPFFTNGQKTVAPGNSAIVTVELDRRISAGPWKAKLSLQSGSVQHSASANLVFGTEEQASVALNVENFHWLHYLITVSLLIAAGVGVWLHRRTRSQGDAR